MEIELQSVKLLSGLPEKVAEIQSRVPSGEEFDGLKGQGVKIIIPSNLIDFRTRLEVLLVLKLSGRTDTLTEASNLKDEFYKRVEIQNEQ